MTHTYSGFITANEGFETPEPFDGPVGWTVYKKQQTEIFEISHHFNLKRPHRLHVVATSSKPFTFANVEQVAANSFTISVWTNSGAPAQTDITFVAVLS
jgi:hypothetical protein